jgi:predicted transcriptional regulator
MTKTRHAQLSRRERQIMDVLYRHGRATAADVQTELPDPPGYSAVRAMLRILEAKGHTRHEQDGPRYVYVPTLPRDRAKRSALKHLLNTFFEGSAEQVVAALLEVSGDGLSEADLSKLRRLIDQARAEARREKDGQ